MFKTLKDKIIRLYKGEEFSNLVAPAAYTVELDVEAAVLVQVPDLQFETTVNLIKSQTCIRTYQMTGSLNQNISNLILDTICPTIQMAMRVIYSFSCLIYRGRNQIIQYRRTFPDNCTLPSLSQIEEYI